MPYKTSSTKTGSNANAYPRNPPRGPKNGTKNGPRVKTDLSAVTRSLAKMQAANETANVRRKEYEAAVIADPSLAAPKRSVFSVTFKPNKDGKHTGEVIQFETDGKDIKPSSPVSESALVPTSPKAIENIQQPSSAPANMDKLMTPFKSPLKRNTPAQPAVQSSSLTQEISASTNTTAQPIEPLNTTTTNNNGPANTTATKSTNPTVSMALATRELHKSISHLAQAGTLMSNAKSQAAIKTTIHSPKQSPTIETVLELWLMAARATAELLLPLMYAKVKEQGGFESVQRGWAASASASASGFASPSGSGSGCNSDYGSGAPSGHASSTTSFDNAYEHEHDGDKGSDNESDNDVLTMRKMLAVMNINAKLLGWCEGADGEGEWDGSE